MLNRLASPEWRAAVAAELRAGPKALRTTVPWLLRTRLNRVESLLQVVLGNADKVPDDLALEMGSERFTWSRFADATSRVAHVLAESGSKPGDVIALLGLNSPFYLAAIMGISRVGGTAALINSNLQGRPLAHAIGTSGARTVLVESTLEEALRRCDEVCAKTDEIFVYGGGALDDRLASAPAAPYPPASLQSDHDFVYIYTSGTTGLPKPCRVSHVRAIMAGASFGPLVWEFRPGDKLYCVLPLYHSSALLLGAASAMVCRTPMAMRARFSASEFWSDVHRYQATALLYIGELCRYLVNTPPSPLEKPNPIRVAAGNGLRPDVWSRFQRRFEIDDIREFYAATEAPGFIINLSGRQGSVGHAPLNGLGMMSLVRYDVNRDEHVRDRRGFCIRCGPGEAGELLIKVPEVATPGLEYRGYTDEEASAKKLMHDVFKRGDKYFRPGDLLRQDAQGFFYFVDRIGDTFRWKGENVSTAEVADVITQSDAFDEATVVGVRLPAMEGKAGLVAVVPSGKFDREAFAQAVTDLPSYAQPRFVRVMDGLRTTGTFKIQKATLESDGVDPSTVADPLYVRTPSGYETLTQDRWTELLEGRLQL